MTTINLDITWNIVLDKDDEKKLSFLVSRVIDEYFEEKQDDILINEIKESRQLDNIINDIKF